MADNTRLNKAEIDGDIIATDEISGIKYQRVKLIHGADGVNDGDVSSVNPLPVGLDTNSLAFDAFSRLRVSSPKYLFDAQLTYDLQPLVFEQVATANAGIAHDATNRMATMTFTSAVNTNAAYMQSYEWLRYQPGRSQLIFVTFNFRAHTADCRKFAGYSDGNNGVEIQSSGTGFQVTLYSDTGHSDETIAQASWNLDPMDGSGPSGLTLNVANAQIFVIDFQALYVGRVRVGFDINGVIYPVHQFTHANIDAVPYIQNASLPVRCGMVATGNVATAAMDFICSSVMSEGGEEEPGYLFSQEGTVSAGSGARTHVLSIQPEALFNSIANRTKFVFESLDVAVTGNFPIKWEMVLGDVLTGSTTFSAVNATYSAMEYNTAGTTSGAPAIVVAQGYVASTATQKGVTTAKVNMRYPITLDAAGAARALGRITVLASGIGGASAMRAVLNWREVR